GPTTKACLVCWAWTMPSPPIAVLRTTSANSAARGRSQMTSNPYSGGALLALAASAMILAGCAAQPDHALMAGSIDVGRNAEGDPCRATRTYEDPALKGKF